MSESEKLALVTKVIDKFRDLPPNLAIAALSGALVGMTAALVSPDDIEAEVLDCVDSLVMLTRLKMVEVEDRPKGN